MGQILLAEGLNLSKSLTDPNFIPEIGFYYISASKVYYILNQYYRCIALMPNKLSRKNSKCKRNYCLLRINYMCFVAATYT